MDVVRRIQLAKERFFRPAIDGYLPHVRKFQHAQGVLRRVLQLNVARNGGHRDELEGLQVLRQQNGDRVVHAGVAVQQHRLLVHARSPPLP
ncbi:hypothetical protein SDC9_207616 [bioreactor metagenome]|uniref:Uncharacterized protein n=1 Tax=bioreactor metagenome TaxID=1076179 RepID=A0A645JHS6_9ZZZZ